MRFYTKVLQGLIVQLLNARFSVNTLRMGLKALHGLVGFCRVLLGLRLGVSGLEGVKSSSPTPSTLP